MIYEISKKEYPILKYKRTKTPLICFPSELEEIIGCVRGINYKEKIGSNLVREISTNVYFPEIN